MSKKTTLHVQHTFYVHFFSVVLHDFIVKLSKTSTFYGGNVECVLRLYYFFAAAHLHLGGRLNYSYRRYKMLVFFSVIRVNVDIKIKSKERIGFVVVFFLFLGVRRFTFRNGRVLEMQNSTPAYVKGYTYVLTRTDDFLRTKIYWMHR